MIEKITPLGDIHSGRQTQLFENEKTRYIIKPRDFKTEAAFSSFCKELSKLGTGDFSRTAKAIEIHGDFHTEEIEENHQTTDEGAELFYKRAGTLLFVCYLLFSKDMHCENIIASGDIPVLLDLETLLSGKTARSLNSYNISKSVMCSHLLCNFASAKDVSGFTGVESELKNIPHTENGKVFLWQKKYAFINGFEMMYNTVLSHKNEVEKLIHLFDNCRFRQILRPTQTYSILSNLLKSVDDDKKESVAFTLLAKAYQNDIDKNRLEKAKDILTEELRSVICGEIPLFHTPACSTDLYVGNKLVMKDFLELSPIDYAVERLKELSDDDLRRQLKIINLAISASTPVGQEKNFYVGTSSLAPGEICAKAVTDSAVSDLPSVFCGLNRSQNGDINFSSVGFSLYSGLIGVLCMYAALYRKSGKKEYLDLLFKYYQNFFDVILKSSSEIVLTDKNISLADGYTGMLAGLLHIGELIENNDFKDAAKTLADRFDFSALPDNPDYLNSTGALPVFLNKFENKKIIPLCEKMSTVSKSFSPVTTGLAHGASGLMLTLAVIDKYIPDNNILPLLEWEESNYSGENNNWYDLRDKSKKGFMSGWCSGAPGIGMARDALRKLTDNKKILCLCDRDIDRARLFLEKETATKKDSLCCGTAARLMAASRLGVNVDNLFRQLSDREKNADLRLLNVADTNDIKVSLMQGLSGIAYALSMYGDPLSGGMTL